MNVQQQEQEQEETEGEITHSMICYSCWRFVDAVVVDRLLAARLSEVAPISPFGSPSSAVSVSVADRAAPSRARRRCRPSPRTARRG